MDSTSGMAQTPLSRTRAMDSTVAGGTNSNQIVRQVAAAAAAVSNMLDF
jgi:hypothetical protein